MEHLKEHQRKYIDIKSTKPSKAVTHVNGEWYRDEQGNVVQIRNIEKIEAQRKYAQIQRASEERSQKRYVNCYHEPIKDITSKLKLNELGALLKLLPYLRFNGNGLLEAKGKPMSSVAVAQAIGKSGSTSKRVLDSLIEEGVIVKEGERKSTRYYVAEKYHTIGYTLQGQRYTKLYQVETRKKAENLSIQEAGLLYKMLPYFHYTTYFLVANPDADTKEEELDHLNQAQLARLIDESENVVRDGVKALMAKGFVNKLVGSNSSKIIVNPDVMFRAEHETEHTNTIRMQFAEVGRCGSFE